MPVSHSHQFLCVSLPLGMRRDELRILRIGDVPDLVRLAAERAQQIDRVRVALGQRAAVARAHHLAAARLAEAFHAGEMLEVFRLCRVGDVDDRGAVEFRLARHRVVRLGHRLRAAVMPHIGDVAVALAVDHRLIGAARLQVVVSDQPHVLRLGRIAHLGRLRQRWDGHRGGARDAAGYEAKRAVADHRHLLLTISHWAGL